MTERRPTRGRPTPGGGARRPTTKGGGRPAPKRGSRPAPKGSGAKPAAKQAAKPARPARPASSSRPARPTRSTAAARPTGNPRLRMRALMLVMLMVLSLFGAQLLRIQGFDSQAVAADALRTRTQTEAIPAGRGTIYDAGGTVLATSQERRTVVVDQTAVPEYTKRVDGTRTKVGVEGAAADLAPLLGKQADELVPALSGDLRYRVLVKNISPLTWRKVRALGIPGIYSERASLRTYPQSTTVASLVGFVQPQDQTAGGGLELMLDKHLKGVPGKATYQIAQDGSRLPNAQDEVSSATDGKDVRLTIDNDVQWYALNALAAKVKESKAVSGTVVVQRVDTGELVALASYPTFDPNNIGDAKGVFSNLALSDVFEPGSTSKVMTVAAGLEEGTVTPDTPLVIPGELRRYDRTLRDSHPHPTQYRTVSGALAESSNIGMMLISETMSPQTLEEYFRRFGLGRTTGLGFPGESAGLMPKAESWDGVQQYTVTYGQGLSTTAVQVTNVFQTIANGGVRVSPTLVKELGDGDGGWKPGPAATRQRVVSEQTAKEVALMLEGATSDEGTAPQARIKGYRVAGKTGTADRYDPKTGGYNGKTASFIGFAPAEDPQLVVSVIVQDPKKNYFGGTTAAPVFKDVMTYALQREQVPPTPAGATTPKLKLKLKDAPADDTPGLLKDKGLPPGR